MIALTNSRMWRGQRTLWLALAGVLLLLPVSAPAQTKKDKSAEEILNGLLGGGDEGQSRGIGHIKVEPSKVEPRGDQPAAAPSGGRIAVPIQFKYNSAEINPESFDQLRSVAAALSDPRLQSAGIRVEGHTDNQGPDSYNQSLSERRADAIKRYLVEKENVSASRIEARGYGKSRPLPDVSQDTDEGRALNRRVEFVNLGGKRVAEATRPLEAKPNLEAQADLKVNVVVTYKRDGETRTLASGGVLTPNDNYRVTFTPNENSYVYVFQIDPKGKAEPVFPNSEYSKIGNPAKARQAYNVPPEGQWLSLDQAPGDEEIVVVASRNELADAKTIAIQQRGQGLTTVMRGPAAEARADVAPELPPGVFSYRLPFKHR